MKALSVFLLLFFSFQLLAQPQVARIIHQQVDSAGNWVNHELSTFSYDDSGNLSEKITSTYNSENKGWEQNNRKLQSYDEQNNLTKIHWEFLDSLGHWQRYGRVYFFKYNEDNCQTEEVYWRHTSNNYIYSNQRKTSYITGCQIDSIKNIERYLAIDSTLQTEYERHYEFSYSDDGLTAYQKYSWFGGGEWHTKENARVTEYDENDRAIVYVDSLNDYGPVKFVTSYYPGGELNTVDHFHWRGDHWKFEERQEQIIEYNESGLPIEYKYSWFDPPSGVPFFSRTTFYTYYCDDLLRVKYDSFNKYIYEYTEPADCFELPEEGIDILMFPNPAKEKVFLFSPTFQSGDLVVSVVDSGGRTIFRQAMPGRTESIALDVSEYPVGIYFVRLNGLGETKTVTLLVER